MAINPSISLAGNANIPLAGRVPSVSGIFGNTLLDLQRGQRIAETNEQRPLRNRLLEAQVGQGENVESQQREQARVDSIVQGARELLPILETGNVDLARSNLIQRKQRLVSQGLPTNDTDEALAAIDQPGGFEQLKQITQAAIQLGQPGRAPVAVRSSAPIIDPETGQLSIPTFDPNTQKTALVPLEGAVQETPEQRREAEATSKIDIALKSATAKAKVARTSAIKKELSTRNRDAAREQVRLNQALKVASTADQGITGAVALQLAKLVPGIDVTNEALLDQTLGQLTIDQLQKFKGPTTDFEFSKAQQTVGAVGDSKTANIARLKSLQRANWFNRREFEQFKRHSGSGGDPDSFSFNFGEPVKTKKGVFTLRDIQDTAVQNNLSIEETIKQLNK